MVFVIPSRYIARNFIVFRSKPCDGTDRVLTHSIWVLSVFSNTNLVAPDPFPFDTCSMTSSISVLAGASWKSGALLTTGIWSRSKVTSPALPAITSDTWL